MFPKKIHELQDEKNVPGTSQLTICQEYIHRAFFFSWEFEDPIGNGQCVDSSDADISEARKKAFVLRHELDPMVLRRDGKFLQSLLGEKREWVLVCEMTGLQKQLYKAFLRERQRKHGESNKDIISAYHLAMAICNHPDVVDQALRASNMYLSFSLLLVLFLL